MDSSSPQILRLSHLPRRCEKLGVVTPWQVGPVSLPGLKTGAASLSAPATSRFVVAVEVEISIASGIAAVSTSGTTSLGATTFFFFAFARVARLGWDATVEG